MVDIYRQDLISYVYCSHATPAMSDAQIPHIIESAKRRNPNMEVTGLLTYGGGMFLQWLEGPHHFVHELMARIRKDPRHDCVLQLHALSGLRDRLYPDWSMQHIAPAELKQILVDRVNRTTHAKHAEAVTLMLQLFDDGPLKPLLEGQH